MFGRVHDALPAITFLPSKGERTRTKSVANAILSAYRFKMQIHLSDLLILQMHESSVLGTRYKPVGCCHGSSATHRAEVEIRPI
jgi:hypothetical protein